MTTDEYLRTSETIAQAVDVLEFESAAVARRQLFLPDESIGSAVLPEFHASPAAVFGRH